ncbi:rCG44670 [Rattus norvegicus]|uniref:RCG44670 n=1 Tax=Rattus norvegicus TaxID=10116 RepID=A6I5I9_RAT|nr:rCG44670 [Rattus norvegicus]
MEKCPEEASEGCLQTTLPTPIFYWESGTFSFLFQMHSR